MTKVVFVGDEPSKKNIHPSVPFIGAACHKRLVKWIKFLAPDYYCALNSDNKKSIDAADALAKAGCKVVALGREASLRLNKIPHHRMPHPSPQNRDLNDTEFESEALKQAYYFIHDKRLTSR